MKYLDVLKKFDTTILSESKRLDDEYKRILGESCEGDDCTKKEDETKKDDETKKVDESEEKKCDCGKEDCPICGKKTVDEGCDKDKQMTEFDEGDKSDGKTDKKMLSKDEFLKLTDDGEKTGDEEKTATDGEGAKKDD